MADGSRGIASALTGPRIAARVVLAALLAVVVWIAAMASPESNDFKPLAAATDPQPTPSSSAAGSTIRFINPDSTTSLEVSNKDDGANQAYHIVAAVSSVPSTPTVQFRLFNSSDQQIDQFNATRVGSTDTWEFHWDLAGVSDATYELRAVLLGNNVAVAGAEDSHDVSVNKTDSATPVGDDATAAETVEITYPTNGGQLGVYRPSGGTSNFVMEGTTSSNTRFVRGFYSVEPAGTEPAFKSCTPGNKTVTPPAFVYRCSLPTEDASKAITAVAMVPNDTPNPIPIQGGSLNDSGDGHRTFSYAQEGGTVKLVPSRTNQAPTTGCVSFTATVLDQVNRPIAGLNLDTHAIGPNNSLKYKTDGGGGNEARVAPDMGHGAGEAASGCTAGGAGPNQGTHPVGGGNEEKHVETPASGGTNDNGEAIFGLISDGFGTTQVVAWSDTTDNDVFDFASEKCGIASIGWGQPNQAPIPSYPGFSGCVTQPSPTPSSSVSGSPTTSPSTTPSGSPSGSPSTSPSVSTSPTSPPPTTPTEPEKERHSRDITVNFTHGSLIVSGRLSVDDGTKKCRRQVQVKIQRKKKGKFRTLKSTVTNRKGRFSVSVADRTGTYRVKAPKTKKGQFNQDVCLPTKEVKKHRHK